MKYRPRVERALFYAQEIQACQDCRPLYLSVATAFYGTNGTTHGLLFHVVAQKYSTKHLRSTTIAEKI